MIEKRNSKRTSKFSDWEIKGKNGKKERGERREKNRNIDRSFFA